MDACVSGGQIDAVTLWLWSREDATQLPSASQHPLCFIRPHCLCSVPMLISGDTNQSILRYFLHTEAGRAFEAANPQAKTKDWKVRRQSTLIHLKLKAAWNKPTWKPVKMIRSESFVCLKKKKKKKRWCREDDPVFSLLCKHNWGNGHKWMQCLFDKDRMPGLISIREASFPSSLGSGCQCVQLNFLINQYSHSLGGQTEDNKRFGMLKTALSKLWWKLDTVEFWISHNKRQE